MGVMPSNARKGHAQEGCWSCPLLLTQILLPPGQRKVKEGQEKEGREGGESLTWGRETAPGAEACLFWPEPRGNLRTHFTGAVLGQKWLSGPWRVDC